MWLFLKNEFFYEVDNLSNEPIKQEINPEEELLQTNFDNYAT